MASCADEPGALLGQGKPAATLDDVANPLD